MKKSLLKATFIGAIIACSPISVFAGESASTKYVIEQAETARAEDVIVYKYRYTSAGTLQYRRWNETRRKWIAPYWINVN